MRRYRRFVQASICKISRFALFRIFLFPLTFAPGILAFAILGLAVAWAQDASTGALRGSVLDAQGAVVTNADIVAICVETGVRYHTATDVAGRFAMDLLPPGNYSTRAEAEGMSPQISPVLRVEVGAAQQLTFKLMVAGPKETVTVSGTPLRVETSPTAVSSVLDEQAISSIPLNGRRFTDLLLLAPGVTQDPRGLSSGSNGDLSYGGIRGYNTSYLVDGTDNNNGFFAQARGRYRSPYQFSDEVVAEFRVSSNSYGAESGRSGGAVVNVVTKSGSNSWHNDALSGNGEEDVTTESASISLLSSLTARWTSQLQRQRSTTGSTIWASRRFCRGRRANTDCIWRRP